MDFLLTRPPVFGKLFEGLEGFGGVGREGLIVDEILETNDVLKGLMVGVDYAYICLPGVRQ